jgi:2-aminoethylphosphonate-pyruvate transaminase
VALPFDFGSRDPRFIEIVADVRTRLVGLATAHGGDAFTAVPIQGSGSFGVEAMLGTLCPRETRTLVLVNGAYGRRMVHMLQVMGRACEAYEVPENTPADPEAVAARLDASPDLKTVVVVHCETTTGLLNPVEGVARVAAARGRRVLVDAMSSFGAVPLDAEVWGLDAVVSSANKCIEGVPGFSFAVVRRSTLAGSEGNAHSVSLDLHAQWLGLERDGQFRFTPPTQALAAFRQALLELEAEGGPVGRLARYTENQRVLLEEAASLGLETYLPTALQSPIITTFHQPADPAFDFRGFYDGLASRGLYIYPGKLTQANCFRVGTIGRLFPEDFRTLGAAMRSVLAAQGVTDARGPRVAV